MGAVERDEFLRTAWRMMVAGEVETERFMFVDEVRTNTALSPSYVWTRRGKRVPLSVLGNRGKNTTQLSSMTTKGMGPCLAVEGDSMKVLCEAKVEGVLVPALRDALCQPQAALRRRRPLCFRGS